MMKPNLKLKSLLAPLMLVLTSPMLPSSSPTASPISPLLRATQLPTPVPPLRNPNPPVLPLRAPLLLRRKLQ